MSDELDRVVTEGTIVDDSPITSEFEARNLMDYALTCLERGNQQLESSREALATAERRQAWKVLGFASWHDCLASGVAAHFHLTVDQAQRIPLVAQMRRAFVPTSEMAETLHVNTATIHRDLQRAREAGLLDDEPAKVTTKDGRSRPTTRSAGAKPTRKRQDLAKTWLNCMDDLNKRVRAIRAIREDDRYATRLPDLTRSLGDLQTAITVLSQVVEDFQIVNDPPD